MKLPVFAALALLLAGCAYKPVVDTKMSKNPERFDADLAECRQIAEGGGGGGHVAGGARGAGASGREKREIVRNCLKGRGHAVLN